LLKAWRHVKNSQLKIQPAECGFDLSDEALQLFRPDGAPFATYSEISQQLATALQDVEQERQRAEQEKQRAEQGKQRAERLAERLRAMGIDPEAID
jgi:flagellar hook-basal body complex protein FliE